jgi:hypothetical protein
VNVQVEIERLTLEGFRLTPRERLALGLEVADELKGLLLQRVPAWPSEGAAVRRVISEPTPVAAASAVGPPIARAIHDGILRAVGS